MAKLLRKVLTADTAEELDEKIERLFVSYHPQGYDTRIVERHVSGHEDGTSHHVATYTRFSTCD